MTATSSPDLTGATVATNSLGAATKHLTTCGLHDAGLPMGCTCETSDPRPVIADLVAEVERLRAALIEERDAHAMTCANFDDYADGAVSERAQLTTQIRDLTERCARLTANSSRST